MKRSLLGSKVVVFDEEPEARSGPPAATLVAGAVGVAERGPLHEAVLCTSFDEYQAIFGGFTPDSDLALAAMGFFENGGSRLWISRVASPESAKASVDLAVPFTAFSRDSATCLELTVMPAASDSPLPARILTTATFPVALSNGDVLHIEANGNPYTATFEGSPAVTEDPFREPYALADGMTLILTVDGSTQTVTFSSGAFEDIGAASAQEVADAINAQLVGARATVSAPGIFHVETLSKGTASTIQAIGGSALSGVSFPAQMLTTAPFPVVLSDGMTLILSVDGSDQRVTFTSGAFADIGAAIAPEIADAIRSQISEVGGDAECVVNDIGHALRFTTAASGSSASLRASGPAAAVLGLDTGLHVGGDTNRLGIPATLRRGTGTVANLGAVTWEEMASLLSAAGGDADFVIHDMGSAIRLATIAMGHGVTLRASGSAASGLGLDTGVHLESGGGPNLVPAVHLDAVRLGTFGNTLSARIDTGSDPDAFNLFVYRDGTRVETFEDLSRDASAARFIETIVNDPSTGSRLVRATDLPAVVERPQTAWAHPLVGGVDGAMTDSDFIGDPALGTGLFALDAVADLALLFVPGRVTAAVHAAMIAYCEQRTRGRVFAVLDPPARGRAVDLLTSAPSTDEEPSEHGAVYWPRVIVLNPDESVFGPSAHIVVPPSGIVAGFFARTDAPRPAGIHDPARGSAAEPMIGVLGFETHDAFEEPPSGSLGGRPCVWIALHRAQKGVTGHPDGVAPCPDG